MNATRILRREKWPLPSRQEGKIEEFGKLLELLFLMLLLSSQYQWAKTCPSILHPSLVSYHSGGWLPLKCFSIVPATPLFFPGSLLIYLVIFLLSLLGNRNIGVYEDRSMHKVLASEDWSSDLQKPGKVHKGVSSTVIPALGRKWWDPLRQLASKTIYPKGKLQIQQETLPQ